MVTLYSHHGRRGPSGFSSKRLGQFWRAEVGKFSEAPKNNHTEPRICQPVIYLFPQAVTQDKFCLIKPNLQTAPRQSVCQGRRNGTFVFAGVTDEYVPKH
jgi:hypothetical protein